MHGRLVRDKKEPELISAAVSQHLYLHELLERLDIDVYQVHGDPQRDSA